MGYASDAKALGNAKPHPECTYLRMAVKVQATKAIGRKILMANRAPRVKVRWALVDINEVGLK